MTARLPITTSGTPSPEERREIGRRGVAQARAALAEARRRSMNQAEERTARREAELLSGANKRRPSNSQAA